MEFRSPIILAAAPVGLALACIGWLLLGGAAKATSPLDQAQSRLNAAPTSRASQSASTEAAVATAVSAPLFANTGAEIAVRLEGISKSPARAAALLSINGGPAQWVSQGSTSDGVTLVQVSSTRVVIDSRSGRQTVALGETSGTPADLAGGGIAQTDQPPPGVRMPPPPASAPGAP